MELWELSKQKQAAAWKVVEDTQVITIWETIGAEVYMVGSLRSGLLMKNQDIDFHIYTEHLHVGESFAVIKKLAEHPGIQEIQYRNLADTEEECLEWHVWYEDPAGERWKLDMIHIRKGSRYDGAVERMTDAIIEKLTPEIRDAILQIKQEMPEDIKAMGVEIYQAVFSYGIRNCPDFVVWYKNRPPTDTLEWLPE